jgi:hypothetical protein
VIALSLVVYVDRAARSDLRYMTWESDLLSVAVETTVLLLVTGPLVLVMAAAVGCAGAVWCARRVYRWARGGGHRLGRMVRARWDAAQGRARKWVGGQLGASGWKAYRP